MLIVSLSLLHLPIYNALLVQKFKSRYDFGTVETCTLLRKTSTLLYVEHEISAIKILHHKEQMTLQG